MKITNYLIIAYLLFFCLSSISAQTILSGTNIEAYRTIERSNLSRYDNGRYIGLTYREIRATLYPVTTNDNSSLYQGNFFVLEETLRDMRQSARAVNDMVPVRFQIFSNGNIQIDDDRGFPSLRGFPAFPSGPVYQGSKWTAAAVRVVDPLNEGIPVAVPIIAEYEYHGIESYNGIPVHRISARYASRYQSPSGSSGEYFTSLQGTHQVDIFLRVSDGLLLMMRDNLDETYTWSASQRSVRFRGFTLTFGEGIVPLNTDFVIESVGRGLNPSETQREGVYENPMEIIDDLEKNANIELTVVPGGVKLTVKDIRFIADSDEILPSEYPRIDIIARALLQIPDRTFLVEGHTAVAGLREGEMELSVLRAKRMVDELVSRGISADRFLYTGYGGDMPIGDNSTEEGRALNRRVEITVLE